MNYFWSVVESEIIIKILVLTYGLSFLRRNKVTIPNIDIPGLPVFITIVMYLLSTVLSIDFE